MRQGWILTAVAIIGLAGCEPQSVPESVPAASSATPTGAEDFAVFCAACHGPGGRGDGPASRGFDVAPADLTRIAARNNGAYPATAVMAKIWGYTGGQDGDRVMPKFGALLQSDTVHYDAGDGIPTPTPLRLVQLTEFVQRLQVME
jgi:mono/diheme cytochrome c family protein